MPSTQSAALLAHKSQLKPKAGAQLESVFETSWEHLLMDQSPRLDAIAQPRGAFLSGLQQHKLSSAEDEEEKVRNELDSDEDGGGEDVCDGDGSGATTQASSVTTANTALPAANSKRSSISTTAGSALTSSSAPPATASTTTSSCRRTSADVDELLNEIRQYGRGRFYTLELDLSCTKNKFPITDRSRKMPMPKEQTRNREQFPQIINQDEDYNNSIVSSDSSSLNYSNMTKSLAGSMTKPMGSLYCEKRLQTSKSEAVLADKGSIGSGGGGVGVGSGNGSIKWLAGKATGAGAAAASSSTTTTTATQSVNS